MKYTRLGRTGLDVSQLCLGCMSYGSPDRGTHDWALDEEASRPFIKEALELGINFFDTANVYSLGESERVVGKALADFANRDEVVIASKVFMPMREGRNAHGNSRKTILTEVEHSLRRLGTDYIDLYQLHRWDPRTPIEETLAALDDLVRSGKVRYLGVSSMWTWQFAKALFTADQHGWTRFVSMQNHYNLLNREEEREMLPFCADQEIAVIPWSPMARGKLTRPWGEETYRTETDEFGRSLYPTDASDEAIVDAVGTVAERHGVSRAQIALAWVMHNPTVTAPIIGATKAGHLGDAVAAIDVELAPGDLKLLESSYTPRAASGFR